MTVKIIGAGLAGCEAAYQLSKRGIKVKLYEMKKHKMSPAHKTTDFAELVCSNSFRSDDPKSAVGTVKEEMRILDSLVMKCAEQTRIPSGKAMAVDRDAFPKEVTKFIRNHPYIEVLDEEVTSINPDEYTIIATGPLTSDDLSKEIIRFTGEDHFHFFDAAAPILDIENINWDIAYKKDRWDDDNEGSYINCPMTRDEYDKWYDLVLSSETVEFKDFEINYFEGCMPFEEMAARGKKTLLYGPMKPVGLRKTEDHRPYAVVQLRQDNVSATLYNIVGFQTHIKWGDQKKVIQAIPGLEDIEVVRYGVMHRNSYINSPDLLNKFYQMKSHPKVFFAGQITGVEGYIESSSSGLLAGLNMSRLIEEKEMIDFTNKTAIGSLPNYVSRASQKNFQPMNVIFGIFDQMMEVHKKERKMAYHNRAIETLKTIMQINDIKGEQK